MPTPQPIRILSKAGVKRDGTLFESDFYNSAHWNRFTPRALPKKIGGYKAITSSLPEIVRGMDSFTIDLANYLHLGSESLLTQVVVNSNGTLGSTNDRTPGGFAANVNNLWQIRAMQNKVTGNSAVIAHAGRNLADIASSVATPVYYGDVDSNAVLTASATSPVSGGIVVLAPFLISFGSGGFVAASPVNDPTAIEAGSAYVTSQKIVAGLPLRNTGGPAGLLWSLDSLIQLTFDQNILTGFPFDFNTISDDISVLSSQSIIEYEGIYYWPGIDHFMLYNGVVRELDNPMNLDFFFDNLNYTWRQKAFTFKVPRWGEIWFCAPLFGATECNWAVIYNTRIKTWYDTKLPDGGRSAGLFAQVYQRPFMCDVDQIGGAYTLWQHETGVDKVDSFGNVLPITAFFQTHEFSPIEAQQPVDKGYHVEIVEPDFRQVGDLTMRVLARANARSPFITSDPITIPQTATGPDTQVVRTRVEGRLLSFSFTTNTPGGDYYMGKVIAHIDLAGGRFTQ